MSFLEPMWKLLQLRSGWGSACPSAAIIPDEEGAQFCTGAVAAGRAVAGGPEGQTEPPGAVGVISTVLFCLSSPPPRLALVLACPHGPSPYCLGRRRGSYQIGMGFLGDAPTKTRWDFSCIYLQSSLTGMGKVRSNCTKGRAAKQKSGSGKLLASR